MPNRNGKLRSYRGPATAFAYLLAAGVFVTYALLKRSWTIRNGEPSQYTIEILNPAAIQIFAWAGFIAFWTLLVLCLVSFKTKWIRWPAIGITIALLMYPISIVCHAVNNLGPWTTHGSLVADDGATYVFCDSSFLQGQVMAITERTSSGIYKSKYRVLVDTNGDSPRSWASIIRPDGSTDEYGQLYFKNGYLLGVRYDNRCYLAYELASSTPYGHGDIESISPFICLSAGDTPNKIDLERTCDRINECAEHCQNSDDNRPAEAFLNSDYAPGCPDMDNLDESTLSPDIRSLANSLVACYDAAFDRLKSQLDE